MCKMFEIRILLTILSSAVYFCGAVPFITKCNVEDTKCVTQSANVALPIVALGLPEHGVDAVDPLFVKHADLSSPNLKLILTNVTIKGLKNSVATQIKVDKVKSVLVLKLLCNLQLDGLYDMSGKLLFLPLKGKGPLHVTVRKMHVTVNMNFKEVTGKDGLKHWKVSFKDYSYNLKDKSDVIFENLFDGTDIIATAAKEVIAAGGNEIINEVGSVLIEDVATGVVNEIDQFFEAIPTNELALE